MVGKRLGVQHIVRCEVRGKDLINDSWAELALVFLQSPYFDVFRLGLFWHIPIRTGEEIEPQILHSCIQQ